MNPLRVKHIGLDFDNTLAYLENGMEGVFGLFMRSGISREVIIGAYEASRFNKGFNIDRLIEEVSRRVNSRLDKPKIRKNFNLWLSGSIRLYHDVDDFLLRVSGFGISTSIISAGDLIHQREKISLVGLGSLSTDIVPKVGEKSKVLKKMLNRGIWPILYIDDKARELDAICREISREDVFTVRIKRFNGPHNKEKAEFRHREISSLAELVLEELGP